MPNLDSILVRKNECQLFTAYSHHPNSLDTRIIRTAYTPEDQPRTVELTPDVSVQPSLGRKTSTKNDDSNVPSTDHHQVRISYQYYLKQDF